MTAQSTILLIDLSHLFWTHWHATADQELGAAMKLTVDRVASLAAKYEHVGIFCDTPPYKRKQLHPDYKANRIAAPPTAQEQFRRTKERLAADGHVLFAVDGYEADDLIAAAVALKSDSEAMVIASNDKDLMQLVDDARGVSILHPLRGDVIREQQVLDKWGVLPSKLLDALALQGDKSDNIPGIPGVGPKTAAQLLQRFGSLDELFQQVDAIPQEKQRAAVRAGEPAVRLAKKLITLDHLAPINFEAIYERREPKPLVKQQEFNEEENDLDTDNDDMVDEMLSPPAANAPKSEPPPPPASATQQLKPSPAPADKTPARGTEIVVASQAQGEWSLQLEPRNLETAYKFAAHLYNSRLYSRFPTQEAIWAVIIQGRELGLGAMTALACFHVVEGKPAPQAHFIVARAKAHPDCEYFQLLATTADFAEYETKNRHNPKPTKLRYTMEEAKRAGFKPGSAWDKRPAEMLRKACAVQLVRIEYPDAAMGLYSAEELGDEAA